MADRRKRSGRINQTAPSASHGKAVEASRPASSSSGATTIAALCPVCGRSIPEKRATVRGSYGTLESQPYFETIEWDPDKPFGVRMAVTGRASLKDWEYIDRDEAPELFEALKKRFLDAFRECAQKGWFTKQELIDLTNQF